MLDPFCFPQFQITWWKTKEIALEQFKIYVEKGKTPQNQYWCIGSVEFSEGIIRDIEDVSR